MKYCLKCGAANADSAKFCTECGASLATPETENTNYTYNEVNDNSSVNEADIVDTTYSYGEDTSSETTYSYGENTSSETTSETGTEVLTYSAEKDSKDSEDKYRYTYNADNGSQAGYSSAYTGIAPRNIVVAIILSFVTCGIYQIYWMIKMNNEVNTLANEPDATSGGLVFLFSLITCGIYGIYWTYRMGERCDKIKGSVGGSSGVLYLILTVLGLGIVTYCLIQDTINKAV